MIERTL
ncbi:hypothetical protein YPPY45_3636, partial [Yersinia pestis PY-45]